MINNLFLAVQVLEVTEVPPMEILLFDKKAIPKDAFEIGGARNVPTNQFSSVYLKEHTTDGTIQPMILITS